MAKYSRGMSDDSCSSDDEEEEEPPFAMKHTNTISLCCLIAYFAVGVIFLTWQQGWEVVTSLYVVVQIVTTIGYGDVTIEHGGKTFMTIYVLLGTVLVASLLDRIIQAALSNAEKGLDQSLERAEHLLKHNAHHASPRPSLPPLATAMLIYCFFVAVWVIFFALYESCTCSFGATMVEGCNAENCSETGGTVVGWTDALYMAVITFSTVGFGDYSPQSKLGRTLASLWMILGVLSFGNLVAAVSSTLHSFRASYLKKCRMTRKVFDSVDADKSGSIDRHEFMQYILVREGKACNARETTPEDSCYKNLVNHVPTHQQVSKETLESIENLFDLL
ncbi:unnamed protein product, partial [Effrenium voratum]